MANCLILPWPGFQQYRFGNNEDHPGHGIHVFPESGSILHIFNHAQFMNPSGDISSSKLWGVTPACDPRIGQVSAKFVW